MTLHIIQQDRFQCEVPSHSGHLGTDWDHCIFPKNKRFKKFVNNHFNMLWACGISNRITKETDRWNTKKWLINHHLDGEYRDEFLEWIEHPPPKFIVPFIIKDYIEKKQEES